MNSNVFLTVFTPTYNRANTLVRTYKSLKNQDCKEFIWLIIDDGSSDATSKIVYEWMKRDNGFEIRYVFKENGGMHTAHNSAYEIIDTELNICIDSDDMLAKGAVSRIKDKWEKVRSIGYAGIVGLDADFNGNIIGTPFSPNLKDTRLMDFYSAGGQGDKKLVYRTDVIKQYPPYPVFESEKYVGLAYKYRLIDQDYKLAVMNEVLCNVEYQPDGSSSTMFRQYINNPKGFAFLRKVYMKYPDSKKRLFIDCIHYVASSILGRNCHFISESPRKFLTVLAIPFGMLLTVYIKIKAGRQSCNG